VPVAVEVARGVDLVEMVQVDKPVGGKLGSMDITAEVQEVLAAHQVRHTVETVEMLVSTVNRHQPSQVILGMEETSIQTRLQTEEHPDNGQLDTGHLDIFIKDITFYIKNGDCTLHLPCAVLYNKELLLARPS
jgi:hypothetical protein